MRIFREELQPYLLLVTGNACRRCTQRRWTEIRHGIDANMQVSLVVVKTQLQVLAGIRIMRGVLPRLLRPEAALPNHRLNGNGVSIVFTM